MRLAETLAGESREIRKYLKGIYNQEGRMATALEQIADVLVDLAEREEERKWGGSEEDSDSEASAELSEGELAGLQDDLDAALAEIEEEEKKDEEDGEYEDGEESSDVEMGE